MPDAIHPARLRRPLAPRLLRAVVLTLLAMAVAFWVYKGAHRGWSQNRVPIRHIDEITGIEYQVYEERFVPGIEWLGGAAVLAGGLFGLSFLPRLNRTSNHHTS